jgi:hypothetical protein
MIQILRFHWPLYARTLAGIAIALLFASRAPLLLAAIVPAAFWFASSLLVSWYVYDLSPLGRYRWLPGVLGRSPARWINLHAGVDEAGPILPRIFPDAEGRSFDIFDPREMTEPSIHEARRALHAPAPKAGVDWTSLPPQDAAFVIFTAHELRRPETRVRFFRDLARALRPTGQIALVEHLRDWRNFLAFGPGFLHFLSERTWRITVAAAGLRVRTAFPITPFVRVFILEKTI